MTAKHAKPEAPPAGVAAAEALLPDGLPPLTLADTCDDGNDGDVSAQVLVGKDGRVLMFCAHHYRDHAPALDGQGFTILQDNSGQLA